MKCGEKLTQGSSWQSYHPKKTSVHTHIYIYILWLIFAGCATCYYNCNLLRVHNKNIYSFLATQQSSLHLPRPSVRKHQACIVSIGCPYTFGGSSTCPLAENCLRLSGQLGGSSLKHYMAASRHPVTVSIRTNRCAFSGITSRTKPLQFSGTSRTTCCPSPISSGPRSP